MLAHLTREVPLKKGDFQPSRETKSKNNIVLRFYFLLLSYSRFHVYEVHSSSDRAL
jgi:hypothetical protein